MNKEETHVDYENDEEEVSQPKVEKQEEKVEEKPTTLYIDGFTRSSQIEDIKELVSRVVKPINTEEHFFLSGSRNFCYVTYKNVEDAMKVLKDLDGCQFPEGSQKRLHVRITTITAAEMQPKRPASSQKRPQREVSKPSQKVEVISVDQLFRKTQSRPVIFYKPLSYEEVQRKHKK